MKLKITEDGFEKFFDDVTCIQHLDSVWVCVSYHSELTDKIINYSFKLEPNIVLQITKP